MIDWIQQNYKIIVGIATPIIVAIIGLFKAAPSIKKILSIKGNKNNQLQADGNIDNDHSFNQSTIKSSPNSSQNIVHGNQVINTTETKAIEMMAKGFISTMFPHAEKAFNTLRLNGIGFISLLNKELEKLSTDELEKFSEVDVQVALMSAIKAAARKNAPEMHNTLVKLILDRVQKPKRNIAELAIDESIETVSKLDANLMKILAISFMLSRTKYMNISDINMLFERLSSAIKHFGDIDVSTSKFEYLEAISCGKLLQITSNNLINIISNNYQQLFVDKISAEKITTLKLTEKIKSIAFKKSDINNFELNPIVGLYLFDNVSIYHTENKIPISFSEEEKNSIKTLCAQHKISPDKIESILCKNIDGFNHLVEIWNTGGFAGFSLTAVGIAIGRAYLEQAGFGSYDINIWIN